MTETNKTLDVLLPLGRKQLCYVYVSFEIFTLHTLLIAIICCLQLNTRGRHVCYLDGGLLVIDAASKRSMYLVIMPNKYNNELVLVIICIVMLLLFVNCPAVICLPSMCLSVLWRDTSSELWTLVL